MPVFTLIIANASYVVNTSTLNTFALVIATGILEEELYF